MPQIILRNDVELTILGRIKIRICFGKVDPVGALTVEDIRLTLYHIFEYIYAICLNKIKFD